MSLRLPGISVGLEVDSSQAVANTEKLATVVGEMANKFKASQKQVDDLTKAFKAQGLAQSEAAKLARRLISEQDKLASEAKRVADAQANAAKKAADAQAKAMDKAIAAQERFVAKARAAAEKAALAHEKAAAKAVLASQKQADSQMRDAERTATAQVSSANKSSSSILKLAATFYTVQNAAQLMAGAISSAYGAASEGAKIGAARQFFENAGKSIEQYRAATKGMVSDAELMRKANLADSMGIDEKTFKQLVLVAEASALKTGQSFDHMFESIIVGTARSSRLLLDNLGIIVSVDQANQNYAKSVLEAGGAHKATQKEINAFVESMDAEAKQLAFVQEVAKQSAGTLDEYGKITDKTAESFSRFDAVLQNLADSVKIVFAGALTSAIGPLERLLKLMTQFITQHGLIVGGLAGLGAGVLDAAGALNGTKKSVSEEFLRKNQAEQDAQAMAERNFNISEGLTALDLIDKQSGESLAAVARRFVVLGSSGSASIDALIKDFLRFSKGAGDFFAEQVSLFAKPKTAAASPPPSEADRPARGSRGSTPKDYTHQNENFRDSIAEKIGSALAKVVDEQTQAAEDLLNAFEAMDKRNKKDADARAKQLKDFASVQDEMAREWAENQEKAARAAQDMADAAKAFAADAVRSVASGNGGALLGGVVGGAVAGAVGGPLGSALGALVGILGELLDKLEPVVQMVQYLMDGLGLLIQNAFGPLLNALLPIFLALKVVLASIGMMLQPLFQILIDILNPFIVVISAFVTSLSALFAGIGIFINLIWSVVRVLGALLLGTQAGIALDSFVESIGSGMEAVTFFANGLIDCLVWINNGIIEWVRKIPGLAKFGQLWKREDFGLVADALQPAPPPNDPSLDENTDAVKDNTEALRDFAREFRNLPANFKQEGYIYGATQNTARPIDPMLTLTVPATGIWTNQRNRV